MTLTWEGGFGNVLTFCLIVASLCLELNSSTGHDTSSQHVTVKLLFRTKTKNVEGVFSVFKLLVVIDGLNLSLSLGDIDVIVDVL